MAVKVMIADDHSMIREGLKQLLELEGDFEVIAEACDGVDCLEKLKTVVPDILLLDINMPNMNGLEVLQKMKDMKMKVKVLVLTVHNEVEYLLKAVDIGVNGYLLKDSESAELKKAILAVVNGEDYIQPSLIPVLNSKMLDRDSDSSKIESLTRRELEVLKMLSYGTYNKEILRKTLTSYYWKSFFIIFYYKWMSSGIFVYAVTKSATNQLFQLHRRFFSKCSTCWCKCYNQFIILFHNSKRPYFTVKRLVLIR